MVITPFPAFSSSPASTEPAGKPHRGARPCGTQTAPKPRYASWASPAAGAAPFHKRDDRGRVHGNHSNRNIEMCKPLIYRNIVHECHRIAVNVHRWHPSGYLSATGSEDPTDDGAMRFSRREKPRPRYAHSPAATTTSSASISPVDVSIPRRRPPRMVSAVARQFSMMRTPRRRAPFA